MPDSTTKQLNTVNFSPAELTAFIGAHAADLLPDDASLAHGQGPKSPGKFLGVTFGFTRDQIDGYLRALPALASLPALGKYVARVVEDNPRIAFQVTWQSDLPG